MRHFNSLLSVALLGSILIFASRSDRAQSLSPQQAALNRPVAMGEMSTPAPSVFQGAALDAGVPGGAAYFEGCANQPLRTVQPTGSTLREVLNSITHADPEYVWSFNSGVLNLEPSRGIPALLAMRLTNYDSESVTDAASAVTLLSSSPEVTGAANKLGLTQNVSGSALSGLPREPQPPKKPLDIHLKNVTLLDALNAIVRAQKMGVWMYRETHCGSVSLYDVNVVQ
jgi:hypothetical protein